MLTERNFPSGDEETVRVRRTRFSLVTEAPCAVCESVMRVAIEGTVLNNHLIRYACAAALCAPAIFTAAHADPDESTSAADSSLDEVVVVANKAPEPLSKVGNSVTVLDDAAIKGSQLPMMSDLLATTPGLNVARSGGVGQPTSVFIRGAESDQTVVVVDGVQLNDPSEPGGQFDLENLLTSNVSRIEILRGAQSTLYGSQAIGGVINITTAEPDGPLGGGVTAEGGSHDTGYVSGNIGAKNDALMWRLSGNWYGTSGIPDFDERYGGTRLSASQIGGGSGEVRYDITPDLQADLRGYYVQSRTDFDGYDTPPNFTLGNDNEYSKIDQLFGYAGFTYRSPDRTLSNRLAYQYTSTDTRNFDPNAPANEGSPSTETFYGIGRNQREEYQGTWQIAPGYQLVAGAQHERSTIDTDSPAFDYSGPMPTDNFDTIDSGYAQAQGEVVSGLTLTAGERYDRHNVFGGHSTGALAAAWSLNGGDTILRSSFSQGFKAPSLYQLYSQYGNLGLHPEAGESWDAGIEQRALEERLVMSATYFQRYSRDLIEFFDCVSLFACPNPSGGYYANIARAAAHGAELQATFRATERLTVAGNYTLTDTEDKSPGSATAGNELPRRPKNMANLSVAYRWTTPLSTSIQARYAGPSYDDTANQIKLGGYVLVDLRVAYALLDRLEVYARVENIADKHYETEYQYGTLGRVAYAGMRATF
ncbi:MAG TPA: TonB-dependent receptor [Steroidobacteraceae bacterium]|nr:TonB-dependent receptor [Steroidobacteraceae bacterium]